MHINSQSIVELNRKVVPVLSENDQHVAITTWIIFSRTFHRVWSYRDDGPCGRLERGAGLGGAEPPPAGPAWDVRGPGRTLDLENMRFSGPERTGTVATRGFVDFRKARRRAPAQARGYYKALRRTFDFYRELHSTETYLQSKSITEYEHVGVESRYGSLLRRVPKERLSGLVVLRRTTKHSTVLPHTTE